MSLFQELTTYGTNWWLGKGSTSQTYTPPLSSNLSPSSDKRKLIGSIIGTAAGMFAIVGCYYEYRIMALKDSHANELRDRVQALRESHEKFTEDTKKRIQEIRETHQKTIDSLNQRPNNSLTKQISDERKTTSWINIHDPKLDLVEKARNGKISPVIGRDQETEELLAELLKTDKPNVLLAGNPGVGKTAIVEGLAERIAKGDGIPESLKNVKIISISTSDFLAGTSLQGQFEERVSQFIKDVTESQGSVIVFVDETHTLSGDHNRASSNLSDMLKPALARGDIRMIGCTTPKELSYLNKDKAFMRRFGIVTVEEPEGEGLFSIVSKKAEKYAEHHGCVYPKELLAAAIERTKDLPGYYPDKVLGILDTLGSRHQLKKNAPPEIPVEDLDREIERVSKNKDTTPLASSQTSPADKEERSAEGLEKHAEKCTKVVLQTLEKWSLEFASKISRGLSQFGSGQNS